MDLQKARVACLNARVRMQEAEDQQAGERTWGALLEATSEGLRGGQLFLWNEAARKVEALLGCSAAFDGEPFAQVS